MGKSVGKLFRPVVIEAELRDLVHEILVASSATSPSVRAARRRIFAKTTPANAYLYAVEIRNYLEEKTRIGTEARLFTIAGDLFLTALDCSYRTIGPNFFKDHYSGMLGCYREGHDRAKAVEGPVYAVDLLLLKALDLSMAEEEVVPDTLAPLPAFVPAETTDRRARVRQCTKYADDLVRDAVQQALKARKDELPPKLIDFVGGHRARMAGVLPAWTRFLEEDRPVQPPEPYLEAALEVARRVEHPPLVAGVLERLALLRDPGRHGAKEAARLYYDAADRLLAHALFERGSDACNAAQRRCARAADLFGVIHDRTSAAKALVEQARAFIHRGGDGDETQQCLHRAVRLVIAHRDNLPQGQLPLLHHDEVRAFLENKGYHAEAEAYAATLEPPSR